MSDLIERQAAIDALDKRFDSIPMEQTAEILQLRKDLRELPSAQPERKKGKWIREPNVYGVVYCSECDYELHTNNTNYCPDCGARMEVEHEA